MNVFMVVRLVDMCIVFFVIGEWIYFMMDNWECIVVVVCGCYVIVIGDDDYVDLDFVVFFFNLEVYVGEIDVLIWSGFNYNWFVEDELLWLL